MLLNALRHDEDKIYLRLRSRKYQYIFREIPWKYENLIKFHGGEGCYENQNLLDLEYLLQLQEELFQELQRLAEEVLTIKQKQVWDLFLQGKTQVEIAKLTHRSQSAIASCFARPTKGGFSGLIFKLKKAAQKDAKIQILLSKIKKQHED